MNESASVTTKEPDIDPLEETRPAIDRALEASCAPHPAVPPRLLEAMRYSLLAPGKRLRPALALWSAATCGASFDVALPCAVAVEMIHAYSLVHDDLPAMDDDDLRRGRPTTHIAFDEATAILVGDALLARAFEVLTDQLPADVAVLAVRQLAFAAGAAALVGGQMDDLLAESGEDHSLSRLQEIHRRKTGALLVASLKLGAMAARADQKVLDLLGHYGEAVGLAFQIVDDLLDATAAATEMGKRTGKDAVRGKLTYPGLIGVEASRQRATQLINDAVRITELLGPPAWRLRWLAEYVLKRSR